MNPVVGPSVGAKSAGACRCWKRRWAVHLVIGLAVLLAAAWGLVAWQTAVDQPGKPGREPERPAAPPAAGGKHAVVVRVPAGPPTIPLGTFDEKGHPLAVGCATCHSTKPANADAKLGTPLTQFHQGLVGKHGNLSCTSCHNPADGYATLRLADGKSVPYSQVMTLCAQCHGPQFRDYQHGAHGGMSGHWDLTKGGRVRNNCIDCHDPHAPKYPTVSPVHKPNDRFQTGGGGHE